MTDRWRLPWQFAFACAAVGAVGGSGLLLQLYLSGAAKPLAVIVPLPAVWLAAAAFFVRHGGRPLRVGTAVACVYAAVVNTWLALLVVPWARDRLPSGLVGHPGHFELYLLAEVPLAVVVAAANAVGWWRGRRLADPESEGWE